MIYNDLVLDGIRFLPLNDRNLNRSGFLFEPGKIFTCEGMNQRFSHKTILEYVEAHSRREVGEYNMGLMDDQERKNTGDFLSLLQSRTSAFASESRRALEKVLPDTLFEWLMDELDQENPDIPTIKREIFRGLALELVSPTIALVQKYIEEKEHSEFDLDPWSHFIYEDKMLDTIENDETIDSFFVNGVVAMTTPGRRATILYLENRIKRIHEFYKLDRIVQK